MEKTNLEKQDAGLSLICRALADKGFDPALQLSGYLLTEDPTYIPEVNHARSLLADIERDELLYTIVQYYLDNKLNYSHGN